MATQSVSANTRTKVNTGDVYFGLIFIHKSVSEASERAESCVLCFFFCHADNIDATQIGHKLKFVDYHCIIYYPGIDSLMRLTKRMS